jgi:hypothetical protein
MSKKGEADKKPYMKGRLRGAKPLFSKFFPPLLLRRER